MSTNLPVPPGSDEAPVKSQGSSLSERSALASADSDRGRKPRRRWRWKSTWQWEILLVVYAAYDGSRLLVDGKRDKAMQHGEDILSLERTLHLSPEHWLNHAFFDHSWLGIPADYMYATLHYVLTVGVLFWLWRFHRSGYRQARTWLGLTTMIGLVGFIAFPTAPPRMLDIGHDFVDTLAEHASIGWWGGGGGTPEGLGDVTNEFAAMPSLHVGWAVWCGGLIYRHARNRAVRILGLLYPVSIAIVVMGTANHYLLDAVAGAAVALVGLWGTDPLLRLSTRLSGRLRRRSAPVITEIPGQRSAPPRQEELHAAGDPAAGKR